MHVIEQTDTFTLVGVDAKLGKLTLFDAEGPREPGALERVVLRVRDLDAAAASIPGASRDGDTVHVDAPEGLELALVQDPGAVDFDLDHVVLRVADPEASADELSKLGFEQRN